jgi:uncharacterized protein involved in tolerance to divalent cations
LEISRLHLHLTNSLVHLHLSNHTLFSQVTTQLFSPHPYSTPYFCQSLLELTSRNYYPTVSPHPYSTPYFCQSLLELTSRNYFQVVTVNKKQSIMCLRFSSQYFFAGQKPKCHLTNYISFGSTSHKVVQIEFSIQTIISQ